MEGIETTEQLLEFRDGLEKKIGETEEARSALQKAARRKIPEGEKQELKTQAAECTAELRKLRKEMRMTGRIEERSERIREKVEQAEKENEAR